MQAASKQPKFVYPVLGRAGLGNELFPFLRAWSRAAGTDSILVFPRWMKLRVGPTLRGERDRRAYWRLFKPPTVRQYFQRWYADTLMHSPWTGLVLQERGMRGYFAELPLAGSAYMDFLAGSARPGVISPAMEFPYIALHIRMGDFAQTAPGAAVLLDNNSRTPLSWYIDHIKLIKASRPATSFVVASDGSDEELANILSFERVERSRGLNALDDMFTLARAEGILGSRSTFSSWGSFLGTVPMLVMQGGNPFLPTDFVEESRSVEDGARWLLSWLRV